MHAQRNFPDIVEKVKEKEKKNSAIIDRNLTLLKCRGRTSHRAKGIPLHPWREVGEGEGKYIEGILMVIAERLSIVLKMPGISGGAFVNLAMGNGWG